MTDSNWPFASPTQDEHALQDFIRETQERRKQDAQREAYDRARRAVDENR